MNFFPAPVVWRTIGSVGIAAGLAGVAGTAGFAAGAVTRTGNGLHTTSFDVRQGTVRVHLPDDLAPGDRISGTVAFEPIGMTDAERTANLNALRGTVIDVGGRKMTAAESPFTVSVPATAKGSLPVAFSLAAGRQRATSKLPVSSAPAMSRTPAPAVARYTWPAVVTQGNPARVVGAFDGDAANTRLGVGGMAAPLLAESPRQAVFLVPPNSLAGPAPIALTEQATTVSGQVRSVQVRLTAPKTDLKKGESTQVAVEVSGLQDLRKPLPIRLRTSGPVSAEGGSLQRFDISPGDPRIGYGGVFRTARTLTGVAAGGFDMVAEVVWAHPTDHWLNNRVLHVEGSPGGGPGRWRVPVYDSADRARRKFGVYFDGAKAPALRFCQWIEVGGVRESDELLYISDYKLTTDPGKEPEPESRGGGTGPVDSRTPPPAPSSSEPVDTTEPPKPPPCIEGAVRVLSAEEKTFKLLDGKQELFLHLDFDKHRVVVAAKELADYFKTIAELGEKAGDYLPDGDGAGGAVFGFLLKYLAQGGDVLDAIVSGKMKYLGTSEFTATMDAGLRVVVATCATVEVCVQGEVVVEKRFAQSETRTRETFSKKAVRPDEQWEKISDSSYVLDPDKAARWANEFFTEQANILKGNGDELQKFKEACK